MWIVIFPVARRYPVAVMRVARRETLIFVRVRKMDNPSLQAQAWFVLMFLALMGIDMSCPRFTPLEIMSRWVF
jgi:hypothetical protein